MKARAFFFVGCRVFRASRYRSEEASLCLRRARSMDGPISSRSTRGTCTVWAWVIPVTRYGPWLCEMFVGEPPARVFALQHARFVWKPSFESETDEPGCI